MVLVPLVIFGGKTIQQFNVALLVGVLAGTYSSIFAASPLLTMWRSWERKKAQAAAKRTEEKPMVAAAASRAPAPRRVQPKPGALPAAGGDSAGDAEVAVAGGYRRDGGQSHQGGAQAPAEHQEEAPLLRGEL